jgi:hypothetical protein
MWADTLYLAERNHLLRLAVWGAASVLAATLLVLLLAVRRTRSPLVQHFAVQSGAWGVVELLIALVAWRGLEYRDLQGFTRLDRFLWLNVGLDAGYAAVGLALAITGWQLGRRLGLVGAGVGVVVQGLALLVLDAYLIGVLNRVAAG